MVKFYWVWKNCKISLDFRHQLYKVIALPRPDSIKAAFICGFFRMSPAGERAL
jgi:hypothetical protein